MRKNKPYSNTNLNPSRKHSEAVQLRETNSLL